MIHLCIIAVLLTAIAAGSPTARADDGETGVLRFVVNGSGGEPLACRIHLSDENGKPVQPPKLPFWHDHFVFHGTFEMELRVGRYRYAVERGPEYADSSGEVDVDANRTTLRRLTLKPIANMAAEGWWSGDLHVHRKPEDIELLMQAEDLNVAPVITWWNNRNLWADRDLPKQPLVRFDKNRYYHLMAGEDEREGGALMYFNLNLLLDITGASREYPSPMTFLRAARQQDPKVGIDIEKPFWWDVPIWLALGKVDSIGLANNHMCRSKMYESEAWGRPRDTRRLPAPLGNGYWTQEIYYHILNCGLRIPPSAGSASGVLPNPVGYNRVYVKVDGKFDYAKWWAGLKAGRSFVTNGPLLICQANGQLPGHVFRSDRALSLELEISLIHRDPVSAIQIIQNGEIVHTHSCQPQERNTTAKIRLPIGESGWFLVRAVADCPQTFRFASTAPFYVEIESKKSPISRRSAQFFVDWVNERMQRVKLTDQMQREEVLRYHREALDFWQAKLQAASAP